jgi:hypothetical protein
MKNETEQLEALKDIRKMMKESTRFLSLSGFSGILAGIYALTGAWVARNAIRHFEDSNDAGSIYSPREFSGLVMQLLPLCAGVLILSISSAFYLSSRKARKKNHKLFDHTSKKLLWTMFVPLACGGIVCFSLLLHGGEQLLLICPAMLIFYGLALFSSSRLTLHDVKYLGYLQIMLGLIACFYPKHGLLFWTLGFGVLHIIYGSIMWYKYDRTQ